MASCAWRCAVATDLLALAAATRAAWASASALANRTSSERIFALYSRCSDRSCVLIAARSEAGTAATGLIKPVLTMMQNTMRVGNLMVGSSENLAIGLRKTAHDCLHTLSALPAACF